MHSLLEGVDFGGGGAVEAQGGGGAVEVEGYEPRVGEVTVSEIVLGANLDGDLYGRGEVVLEVVVDNVEVGAGGSVGQATVKTHVQVVGENKVDGFGGVCKFRCVHSQEEESNYEVEWEVASDHDQHRSTVLCYFRRYWFRTCSTCT